MRKSRSRNRKRTVAGVGKGEKAGAVTEEGAGYPRLKVGSTALTSGSSIVCWSRTGVDSAGGGNIDTH